MQRYEKNPILQVSALKICLYFNMNDCSGRELYVDDIVSP